MDNVKVLLAEEIERQLGSLENTGYGSPEEKSGVEDTAKLLGQYNEMIKNEAEIALRKEELKTENIDRWIKNGLTAVSVVGGIALSVWGTNKSLKFEETGTVTTMAGRAFISKLFPKK